MAMTDLDRLIIAEGVQGGVLAHYENMFRRFVNVRLGDLGADGFTNLAQSLLAASNFCEGDNKSEIFNMARLASKASIAHLEIKKYNG